MLARPPNPVKTERSATDRTQTGYSEVDGQIVKRVQEMADKNGWKMSHVALAWIGKRIASPVVGISSIERMEELLEVRGRT